MSFAIRVHKPGGPDALIFEETETKSPGAGEVLIRQTAVGVNFIDVYHRTGLYPLEAPFTPGMEAAGVIEEIGKTVHNFKKGDRVAYATGPVGAYTEMRVMPADRIIALPGNISDEQAAASMVKGMTAEYLLHRTYKVKEGDVILLHAAAGGVGLIATQWAKHLGATVIGTVGSAEKAALAKEHGCDHVILYKEEDIAERVRSITKGRGVDVVYDSVGKDTFEASLDSLKRRGMMVSFGNASGPVEPFSPQMLTARGSLFFTRPSMWDYTADDDEYRDSAAALFDVIGKGIVHISVNQHYALKDASRAHADLEARKTTGSTILKI